MSTILYGSAELLDPVLSNPPREWDDSLVDAQGRPIDPQSLLPNPETRLLTRAQLVARETMARRRWFLVRNLTDAKSRGTGRIETYLTKAGIECPFRYPASISAVIRQRIDPEARTKAQLDAIFGQLIAIGAIEPISTQRAEVLATAIYAATRGQMDLFALDGR